MEKWMYIVVWLCCIGLLSFAYDGFLESELSFQEVNGVVTDKGKASVAINVYGNFNEEIEYWILLDGVKMNITKAEFQRVKVDDLVKIQKTKHGSVLTIE